MNEPLISLNHVRRQLGDTFTLNIEQLVIRQGEVLCLLGPTGAGKTTLLRLLTGLQPPDSGNIQFKGIPTSGRPAAPTFPTITMVHQRPLLLRGSVRKNLEYGLRLRGLLSDSKTDQWLEQLSLKAVEKQDARTLSGGQMQLVALGRALIVDPDILLLDEPTANLDPAHVALVEQIISNIHLQRKLTVVWATHNLFQARRVAHRVALLLNGENIEVASTQDFYECPSDSRTADFVQGKMVY